MPKYKTQTNDLTEVIKNYEIKTLNIGDFAGGLYEIFIPHEGIFKINIESKTLQQWLPNNSIYIGTKDKNAIIIFDQSILYSLNKNLTEILSEVDSFNSGDETAENGTQIGLNILYNSTTYLLSTIYVSYFNHIMTIYSYYAV